jgi:hypothetical protein
MPFARSVGTPRPIQHGWRTIVDGLRFDSLVRFLGAASSRAAAAHNRRRLGQLIVAFGLAAGLELAGETEVIRGKRKKRHKRRKRGGSHCGGPCDRCGIAGNPCCQAGGGADDSGTCGANLLCNAERHCIPCGNAVGKPCCPVPQSSGTCDAADRLVCSFRDGNTCVACGAETEPCCEDGNNTGCDAGLLCLPTIPPSGRLFCFSCGAAGQRCCPSGCNPGLTCGLSGTCGSCPGGADEC